ncbi:hypothetical protein [Nonomuraea africana]|uniref:DUF4386 family protein n=1 Tax=Nonomuraea africana TaxID=46171 RepID=A0ABR9KJL9_9ACTN|nr:hypothetical protein [Nonomuraea africana]MBE1561747.1 hypothetical protein [Nonomuraea africana]
MTSLDTTPRSGADTFARYGMIASAIIAPLALGLALLLAPGSITTEGAAYVNGFLAEAGSYPASAWLSALSAITIIPGALAVARVARAGRPALGLVAMILAFVMIVPVGGNSDDVLYAGVQAGVDPATLSKIYTAYGESLPTSVFGMSFFLGLLGFLLLGVAALLGRTAPTWAAITLIVAPVLVPVPWFAGLSDLAAGGAWVLMAVGMGGVALGLLNQR